MKKLTYENVKQFIEIESNSGCKLKSESYIDSSYNLDIECTCGNIFTRSFNTFKSKKLMKCDECNGHIINWDKEKVRQQLIEFGYSMITEEYIDIRKIDFIDVNEYSYNGSLYNLLSGRTPYKFHKNNPYTIQNIKLWLKSNNKPFELISEKYIGNKCLLQWKCLKSGCKEIFKMPWNSVWSGQNCPVCSGQQVGTSNCLANVNPILAKEWHPTLNSDLTPYDVTCSSDRKVWWLCSKNSKHYWTRSIASRNVGNGCPYCRGTYPSEDNNLSTCIPELAMEWNYTKNKKLPSDYTIKSGVKVWWKCRLDLQHEWISTICNRSNGSGCPECNNESKGENQTMLYLIEYNIEFNPQYRFINCKNINPLPFDFYLPKLNTCIEYQGIQHYESVEYFGGDKQLIIQKEHDQIKRDFCKNNNINLLEIHYLDFNKIEEILKNYIKESKINGN